MMWRTSGGRVIRREREPPDGPRPAGNLAHPGWGIVNAHIVGR